MKILEKLGSRRIQMVVYCCVVLLVVLFVVWDFSRSSGNKGEEVAANWSQLQTVGTSMEWNDEGGSDGPNIVEKSYEGYRRWSNNKPSTTEKEVEPDVVEPEPAFDYTTNQEQETPPEPVMPLVKFEYVAHNEMVEKSQETPQLALPVGTMIYARLLKPIDSRKGKEGQFVYGELVRPLILNARTILPARAKLIGSIKRMRQGHASFDRDWRVVVKGKDQYVLNGGLQEKDYDPVKGVYGAFDGLAGLRMKPLDLTHEPKVHKLERFVEDVVRPLAVKKSQAEILSELELPTLDNPWDVDGFEEEEEQTEEAYYLPSGTEFYIQMLDF